ncbi:MAG: RNA pseudouridine synthase [Bacteroidota bacterium]
MKKSTEDHDFNIGELILYKNNQLIAFNKPAGIGVQSDATNDKSLMELAEIYTKSKVYVIHRLDRPASGVVLMAKNGKALAHLNEQFRNRSIEKRYLALVKNKPEKEQGQLVHHLLKNAKLNKSFVVGPDRKNSKEAILEYNTIGNSDFYTLLDVKLITGRHHQIRVQLAKIGSPIKGDVKYGFNRSNQDKSIHLHAWKLSFKHPTSHEKVTLTAPPPEDNLWLSFSDVIK